MKTLKVIDFSIQALIIAGSILYILVSQNFLGLILIYIGLGIYQPLSFFIQFMTYTSVTKSRQRYGLGVLAFFGLLFVTYYVLKIDNEIFTLTFFGIAAGILAVYYLLISYEETFEK